MKKIALFMAIVTLTACAGYLDRYPLNNPSDDTFLFNETEMEMAVAGMYGSLWFNFDGGGTFQHNMDYVTDICWDRNASDVQVIGQGAHDSKTGFIKNCWYNFYAGIAKANYILQNMDRGKPLVSEAYFNKVKGEALFMRAFYYLFLTELYGDVPYVTKVLSLEEAQVERTPKATIVQNCIKDLDEVINGNWLPATNDPLSGRAWKGAALALKSRMALYNGLWNDCISASEAIMAMEGSQVILEKNFGDLFQYKGESSKERIFSVNYAVGTAVTSIYRMYGSRNAPGHSNKIPSHQYIDVFECTDGMNIDKSPLYNPKDPFSRRDARMQQTLALPGSVFCNYQFETHGDSVQCWNYNTTPATRVRNEDGVNAYASFSGYCWRKYVCIEDRNDNNSCSINLALSRYGEILLNYAEAKIEANDLPSAINALNKVRARAGQPGVTATSQSDLRNAVRRERLYELGMEGFRLFDIRRWKIAEVVMNQYFLGRMKKSYPDKAPKINEFGNPDYTGIPIASNGESADFKLRVVDVHKFNKDRDYLWPIPWIEMETNKKLVQNPGY